MVFDSSSVYSRIQRTNSFWREKIKVKSRGLHPRSADPEANSLAVAAIHTYIHHTYERAVIAGCYARKAFAKCARLEQSS